jgi:hypothetical protein
MNQYAALAKNLSEEGVFSSRVDAAFIVAAKKDAYVLNGSWSVTPEGKPIPDLPVLELVSDINAFGGQHRDQATAICRDKWTEEKEKAEQEVSLKISRTFPEGSCQ